METRYLNFQNGDNLPSLDDLSPYKAIIVIEEPVSQGWQSAVSKWLVDSGCLYMMAWGIDCSSWNDSVDEANLERFNYAEIPDDKFIMTTWHENDSLEEVIEFAKTTARHPDVELNQMLFLHIGPIDRQIELESLYAKA